MKILVVNCGSSSLKYQLINMENDEVLASGKCLSSTLGAEINMNTHKVPITPIAYIINIWFIIWSKLPLHIDFNFWIK